MSEIAEMGVDLCSHWRISFTFIARSQGMIPSEAVSRTLIIRGEVTHVMGEIAEMRIDLCSDGSRHTGLHVLDIGVLRSEN